MVENINQFVNRIENFNQFQSSEMIEWFVYFKVVVLGVPCITAKEITMLYDELKLHPYSNVSQFLSNNSKKIKGKEQKFLKKGSGYILSRHTEHKISEIFQKDIPKLVTENKLRELASKIVNIEEKDFFNEAVKTFEIGAFRASIIMVWLLTLDHLFDYVLANKLSDFIAALRRMNNNKVVTSKDDFGDIKESVFIEACRGANIISNDVRKILDTKLGVRNSFAHPSTISLPKSKAIEFIEDLIENVILKY